MPRWQEEPAGLGKSSRACASKWQGALSDRNHNMVRMCRSEKILLILCIIEIL
jgi:hypothetical protein